ncbi:serine acetyltransferase [Corticibacter populi]|uniref:serine O-acetyltransferase n=1 Tax=Corticibacter populi TaxID=1550736 RepID=A0A3M6QYV1_9BURK|nr:serine O-acetyltransferase EpsC [Corticibacter populi]RMX07692.1 serine acetyltransferase [Corticibacter populi]RZS30204.1 serine O-acetyltransferase [Corticibacter populi]
MANYDIQAIVQALHQVRDDWRDSQSRVRDPSARELPSPEAVRHIIEQLKGALFPMRLGPEDLHHENEDYYVGYTLGAALHSLQRQARLELAFNARNGEADAQAISDRAGAAVGALAAQLPAIRRLLDSDVVAAFKGDPAALSVDEILLSYPGIQAIIHHRVAHVLYQHGLRLLARLIAEQAHSRTGIDIHPGAEIGAGFFIDHGTGVVIGETARIGENVRIYQAVTLGAKRFATDEAGNLRKGEPRHPIVEDGVVIYAGATILGRVTLGKGAVIGGNVWVTESVPAGGSVSQASLRREQRDEPGSS